MKKLMFAVALAGAAAGPALAQGPAETNLSKQVFKNFGACNSRLQTTISFARKDNSSELPRLEKAVCTANADGTFTVKFPLA
jgi:hypothetical protein